MNRDRANGLLWGANHRAALIIGVTVGVHLVETERETQEAVQIKHIHRMRVCGKFFGKFSV